MGGKTQDQLQGQEKELDKLPPDPVPEQNDGKAAKPCPHSDKKHWIGVRVVDPEGKVVKDVTVKLKLCDGSERTVRLTEATLRRDGSYRIDGLPSGVCQISFPEIADVDWKPK